LFQLFPESLNKALFFQTKTSTSFFNYLSPYSALSSPAFAASLSK